MKNRIISALIFALTAIVVIFPPAGAKSPEIGDMILRQTFDLAGERTEEAQFFIMESRFVNFALNGQRTGVDVYKLWLKFVPARLVGKIGYEYTCVKFTLKIDDKPEVLVPALSGWNYPFDPTATGLDDQDQVLGIEHAKFENLTDDQGQPIRPDRAYLIYNTFIDFYSFCNVFAEKTTTGAGIQDLKQVGQKIIHASAFSEPSVNLGTLIAPGSSFKNGEVTLTFKGLSRVSEATCALVHFDSGASSFQMIMKPSPELKMQTIGSSHYKGDLYIDLRTHWVQKVEMDEWVISETRLPFPPDKVNAVTERATIIRNVPEAEFEQSTK